MKRALAFVATTFVALSALALPSHTELTGTERKNEIARKVAVLVNMAYSSDTHTVTGIDGKEMVLKLAMVNSGYTDQTEFLANEEFYVDLQPKDIQFADMIGWGTMGLQAAQDLFASDDDAEGGRALAARRRGLGQTIVKELSEMPGVSFGFTSGSSSYCGISFMGLLVVDEENGLVYEIALTDGGSC